MRWMGLGLRTDGCGGEERAQGQSQGQSQDRTQAGARDLGVFVTKHEVLMLRRSMGC